MTADNPDEISVIVVNYGTAELAAAAVESVLAHPAGGRRVTVHLVDNASPAEDATLFAKWHAERGWGSRVTLYPEQENHGFGRGNNLVLERLARQVPPPRHVMLLNPDARLDNDAAGLLADFLDAHPEAAMAGAGIVKPDGTPVTAAFRFPNPVAEFAQALNFGPVARLARHRLVPLSPDAPRGPVGWVAGAAVMIRFEVLRTEGFFDPAYFLYYEEVDLMLRTTRNGHAIWYLPEARVIHAEGAATRVKSGESARRRRPGYWYRSWAYYQRKNHGPVLALTSAAAWALGAALNHGIARLRGQEPRAPLHFFGDFRREALPILLGRRDMDGRAPAHA